MQTKFLVQNPHNIPVAKVVDIDGVPTSVSIDGFEIHLLSQDGMSGTMVKRFYGAAAAEARDLFKVDAIVTADWSLEVKTAKKQAA